MYCSNCGAEVPEGSVFCISCGTKVDSPVPASQPPQSQPENSYIQPADPMNIQPSYGQPPYGQPPKKGRKKTWMLVAGGVVLLLAVAAVLIFVVFAPGSGWPLSGSTMQTRFVNDGARVFVGAFSDLGNKDMARLLTEPFDVDMDVDINTGTVPMEASIAAAYDKELLGLRAEVAGQDVRLQLDGDTLYYSMYGMVGGLQFDTDEDLSKPMALKDRIMVLVASMQDQDAAEIDYLLVAEAMVNSISEDCFEKSANETTLTLTTQDIVDTLKTLRDKAEEDEALSDALKEMDMNLDELIENGQESVGKVELTITVTIGYEGGKPVNLEFGYDNGTDYGSGNIQFGYEKTGSGTDISYSVDADGSMDANFNILRKGKDVEFEGEIKVDYTGIVQTYSVEGSESWDGDDVEGTVTVTDDTGTEYGVDYNGTFTFGMPKESVEDDSRFEIDKSDAEMQDFEDMMGLGLNSGMLGGF